MQGQQWCICFTVIVVARDLLLKIKLSICQSIYDPNTHLLSWVLSSEQNYQILETSNQNKKRSQLKRFRHLNMMSKPSCRGILDTPNLEKIPRGQPRTHWEGLYIPSGLAIPQDDPWRAEYMTVVMKLLSILEFVRYLCAANGQTLYKNVTLYGEIRPTETKRV